MVMRDSNHNTFVMHLPAVNEDPDNPYLWTDDETVLFRNFIRNARAAGATIDFAIVDSTSVWLDMNTLTATFFEYPADSGRITVRGPATLPSPTRTRSWFGIWSGDSRVPSPSASVGLLHVNTGLTPYTAVNPGHLRVYGRVGVGRGQRSSDRCFGFRRSGSAVSAWFFQLEFESTRGTQTPGGGSRFPFTVNIEMSTIRAGANTPGVARTAANALTMQFPRSMAFLFHNPANGDVLTILADNAAGDNWNSGANSNDDTLWNTQYNVTGISNDPFTWARRLGTSGTYDFAVVDASNARIRTRDGTISDF